MPTLGPLSPPAHPAARIGVNPHRPVNELALQTDVCNIGYPQLVDAGKRHLLLGYTFRVWLESVVTTNFRFRTHSKWSSRINR